MSYRVSKGYPHLQQRYIYGNETVEEENEIQEEELKEKISVLTSISIKIWEEVRKQNKCLKSMDDQFDSTHSISVNTIRKVVKLAKSNHMYYIYYLLALCLFALCILWLIIR